MEQLRFLLRLYRTVGSYSHDIVQLYCRQSFIGQVPSIRHNTALDTTYSLHPNITFVSLLCSDSAKHPYLFSRS